MSKRKITNLDAHKKIVFFSQEHLAGMQETDDGSALMQNIIDTLLLPVFFVDEQGTVAANNKFAQNMLSSMTPLERQLVDNGSRLIDGVEFEYEDKTYVASRNGTVKNKGITGSMVLWQDVTYKRRAEHAMEIYSVFDSVLNSSYDGIFVTDKNGVVIMYNESYCRITGLDASDFMGKRIDEVVAKGNISGSVIQKVFETRDTVTAMPIVKSGRKILSTAKPVFDEKGEMIRVVANVRDISELITLNDQLEKTKELTEKYFSELVHMRSEQADVKGFVTQSPVMKTILSIARRVAASSATVMVTGESGVGKEVLARIIHNDSEYKEGPFVKINCAAIPEALLESELFGYEKGAFTGASAHGKAGLFEVAKGGTVFLDEIGDLPISLQVKLLGVLQDFQFTRVGGVQSIHMNSRVIAATSRELEKMIAEGKFRKDLYYRLNVVSLKIPALSERREDIFPLAGHFLKKFNARYKVYNTLSPQVVNLFEKYGWPGNVREMENLVERLVVLAPNAQITADMLPEYLQNKVKTENCSVEGQSLDDIINEVERQLFEKLLDKGYSTYRIADEFGISQATAVRKINKLGIQRRILPFSEKQVGE